MEKKVEEQVSVMQHANTCVVSKYLVLLVGETVAGSDPLTREYSE